MKGKSRHYRFNLKKKHTTGLRRSDEEYRAYGRKEETSNV